MPVTKDGELSVQISKDQMAAVMQIPSGFEADMLTVDVCTAQFEANGVHVGPHALQQIDKAVTAYCENPGESAQIILVGQPPARGLDGWLDLAPECERPWSEHICAEEDGKDEGDETPAHSAVDHYARSPYIHVKRGQVIGQIIAPTAGTDGVDVTGNSVPAIPGKPFTVKPHDSVLVDAKDAVIAQCSGTLEYAGTTVQVNSLLQVAGRVDFGTGNVDFEGDVEIGKGVCENFKVTALRNAVINGVVEAADLSTGGDLILSTGMFGKDKGTIQVGRDCRAKFLQQVGGEIWGVLCVDKEIINSQLAVRSGIDSPHASLIGGECHVMGRVELKAIGSDAGIQTVLHLGSFPEYTRVMEEAAEELARLEASAEALQKELDMINQNSRSLVADTKEQVTELMCDQMSTQEEYESLKESIDKVAKCYGATRSIELNVKHTIYSGSTIVFGHSAAKFMEPVRGPILIQTNRSGELCYRQGSTSALKPINGVARLSYWD